MNDRTEAYRAVLQKVLKRLEPQTGSGRIAGFDAAQFLVVDLNDRGVEIYGSEETGVVIDPAIGDELQGEITYPTYDGAINAAVRWLNGCKLGELHKTSP